MVCKTAFFCPSALEQVIKELSSFFPFFVLISCGLFFLFLFSSLTYRNTWCFWIWWLSPPHLNQRGWLQRSSPFNRQAISLFTVDFLVIRAKKCFRKVCTRFFFRCLICWQFLVAAGSDLGLWTHTIHFVFCFFMDMFPPIAPHRWEALLTQTLGLKAMISPQEHTSQIYFYRSMYKIHPACLWENPLTPLSLGLSLSAVGLLFTLIITTHVAEFPFSLCIIELLYFNRL